MLNLILLSSLASAAQVCVGTDSFCVTNADNCVTIHSKATGWAAFGIGNGMANADVFFVSGSQALNLISNGQRQPQVKSTQNIRASPLLVPSPPWAKTSGSFCLPDSKAFLSARNFIYGYSDRRPGAISATSASFSIHDERGTFNADFSSNAVTTSAGDTTGKPIVATKDYETIIKIHGILMTISWFFAPLIGVFIARYLKRFSWWYNVHVFCMAFLTTVGSLAGFILIVLYRAPPHFSAASPLGDAHVKFGLAIMVGVVIQTPLGYYINAVFDPNRKSVPWHDKAHWYLGRLLTMAGAINCILGLYFYDKLGYIISQVFVVVMYILLALAVLAYGTAEFTLGAKEEHHSA